MNKDFEWVQDDDRLCLRSLKMPKAKPIVVDFLAGSMRFRQHSNATKNQMIAKAVGLKKTPLRVIDATLGLGTDTFLLASLGCQVIAIEKSDVIFKLTEDGFRRAIKSTELGPTLLDRVRLLHGDSCEVLPELVASAAPDVIYIDPMFPKSKKTALASKEMQILQTLLLNSLGGDENLVATALALEVPRVVVKRPLKAESLVREPTTRIKGTTVRFDIYLRHLPERPSVKTTKFI